MLGSRGVGGGSRAGGSYRTHVGDMVENLTFFHAVTSNKGYDIL